MISHELVLSRVLDASYPGLLDTDPPENSLKSKMLKLEIHQQRF